MGRNILESLELRFSSVSVTKDVNAADGSGSSPAHPFFILFSGIKLDRERICSFID